MRKVVAAFYVPVVVMNILSEFFAGLWLALLGKWAVIGSGFLIAVVGYYAIGIALGAGLVFDVPALKLHRNGHIIGSYLLLLLSNVYTVTILSIWCLTSMRYFVAQSGENSVVPFFLWSYGTALAPILAHGSSEDRNPLERITTFLLQIAYVLSAVAVLVLGISVTDIGAVFVIAMFIAVVENLWMTRFLLQRSSEA